MTPQEKLEEITRGFEARFTEVVNFAPRQQDPSRCPRHNLPYLVFHNGIAKAEGAPSPKDGTSQSAQDAVSAFAYNLDRWRLGPANTLFWRIRPEIKNDGASRWRVYCRAVWV